MSIERSEQELVRRESLKKLKELGVNCYPAELYKVDNYSKQIKESFNDGNKLNVIIAGRLMSRRIMGKASFAADDMYHEHGGCPSGGVVVKIGYIMGKQW